MSADIADVLRLPRAPIEEPDDLALISNDLRAGAVQVKARRDAAHGAARRALEVAYIRCLEAVVAIYDARVAEARQSRR